MLKVKGVEFPSEKTSSFSKMIVIHTSAKSSPSGSGRNWKRASLSLAAALFLLITSFVCSQLHKNEALDGLEQVNSEDGPIETSYEDIHRTKRNSRRVPRSRNPGTRRTNIYSAHLLPIPNQDSVAGGILKWTDVASTPGFSEALNDNLFRIAQNGRLTILHNGSYYIYVQVGVTHLRGRHCTFETVVQRVISKRLARKVIMKTVIHGSSGFQAGIFKFHVNEEIFIRQASASGCPVIFEADRTYLGGYLLKHI